MAIKLLNPPAINTPTIIKSLIAHFALNLHSLSLWIATQINYQIVVRAQHDVPTKYTGPTYGKIANITRQQILTHEKCTGSTGWIYTTIVCLINRKTNTLEISLPELAIETGITEPTLIKHTKYLEQLGLLSVERESAGAKSDKINRYHLAGQGAAIALYNGIKKFSVAQNNLSDPLKKIKGKDSSQTKQNEQNDVVGVVGNNRIPERQFAVLSRNQLAAVNALKKKKVSEPQSRELVIKYTNELPRLLATIKASEQKGIDYPPPADPPVRAQHAVPHQYQYDHPIGPQPKPLPPVAPEFQQQWSIAYNQLELQFDRATFDTWLRSAKLIAIDEGTFVIGVRNGYVRDRLQHRLYRNISRVLSDVTGNPTDLRFEIIEVPKQIKHDEDMPLCKILAQEAS